MPRIDSVVGVALGLLLLSACSGVDERFYTKDDPPKLKDGRIEMLTREEPGGPIRHRRILEAKDGKISCSLEMRGFGIWRGHPSESEWKEVMETLMRGGVFGSRTALNVEPFRPEGGLYHLITVRMGSKVHRFSSQDHSYAMGMIRSADGARRTRLIDLLVRVIRKRATEKLPGDSLAEEAASRSSKVEK